MRFSDSDSIGGGISRNGDAIPGKLGINTSTIPTNNVFVVNTPATDDTLAEVQITASAATRKGLVVQCAASQSAHIFEVQTSSGGVLTFIDNSGNTQFASIGMLRCNVQRTLINTSTATISVNAGNIVGVNYAGACTVTLPGANAGGGTYLRFFFIQDESGAAATNNITIVPNGTDTINGASSIVINTNYGGKILYQNGTNGWFVVSAS